MPRRGETKALILAYLRTDRAIGQMQQYMFERHGVSGGAVREQVHRLLKAGEVERTGYGRYQRVNKQ